MSSSTAIAVTLAVALLAGALSSCRGGADDDALMLGAASSLRDVLPALATQFQALVPEQRVLVTYGGSGTLARQIEGGAGIDLAILAGPDPMDRLIGDGHALASSRVVVASNRMVLVSPEGRPALMFSDLDDLGPGERIAIGNPATVPAGRYARDFLMARGQWANLLDRFVLTEDVTAALTYVKRSQAAAAIVYTTEVREVDRVVVGELAVGPHAPRPEIVVALTGLRPEQQAAAGDFRSFLMSPRAKQIFAEFGFGPPAP